MKLFKKISAAILAGVMALSMVACGTVTPSAPEKTEEDKTGASTESVVLSYINYYRNDDAYNGMPGAKKVATDADYNKAAAAFLETLQADTKDNMAATWNATARTATVPAAALRTRLGMKGLAVDFMNGKHVYVVSKADAFGVQEIAANRNGAYAFTFAELKYEMTENAMAILANYGRFDLDPSLVAAKIGIASGTVPGSNAECVIIVTNVAIF